MATKARQQYFADEISLQKQSREFSISDEIQQKIDGIEEWAQVNVIETVKVNWVSLTPDIDKAVNVEVPEVIDNLYTIDSDNALSAKQWKLLYDYIQNIASRWRFLSNWNSATGLPMTNPSESPYPYKSWDYFVVSNVAWLWGTNYRPDGSPYIIWQASTVVETESVDVSDFYFYDGTTWLLLKNSSRSWAVDSALSTTSTNPVENRVITNALNWKQNVISDLQTIREWAALWATALQPWDSLLELTWTSDDITEGASHLFMTSQERTKLWNQSWVNTWDETKQTIEGKLLVASASNNWYLSSTDWSTFNWKQDAISDLTTIRSNASAWKSASDTIATYWDIVTHNVSEFATAAQGWKADTALQSGDNVSELVNDAWYITDAYHDATKQDKLIAWANIQIAIDWKTISATDTTYVAWDFDIKDLADSTGLRVEWSWKQDGLIAWNNIQIAADGKTISSTDTTYTAWPWISISQNNVISNTQTSAEWWNITWTLSDQTDLNTALGWKQDTLVAWSNIQIAADGYTISATDTTYTAWDWISIDSNNVIDNTWVLSINNQTWAVTVNEVPSWGNEGQVLQKTSSGYAWMNAITDANVKQWTINSNTVSSTTLKEIHDWVIADANNWAIIWDSYTNDVFLYHHTTTGSGQTNLIFYGVKRTSQKYTSQKWDYTEAWQLKMTITYNGSSYSCLTSRNTDDATVTNYLSVEWSGYTTPFIPTDDYQPTSKKYVDDWLSAKADSSSLGTASTKNTWTSSWNVPVLDSNWKLATSTLPWVALTDTFTVSTSSDLTSLSSAEQWDLAIVTSENKTYVLAQDPYSTSANWKQILSPTGWVTSVNWQTWAVTLSIPSITSTTATLTTNWWSSSTQTVSVSGVTASNQVIVAPDPSDLDDYAEKGVYCSGQGSGTLTFTCDTTPTASITVNVLIINL